MTNKVDEFVKKHIQSVTTDVYRLRRSPVTTGRPLNRVSKQISATLLVILPAILFFSYYPRIPLSTTDTMNLEFSLPLLCLAAIAFLSLFRLPSLIRNIKKPILVAFSIIPCYATISLVWSNNPLRTLLTAGILWCIALTLLSLMDCLKSLSSSERRQFFSRTRRLFLSTAILISIFAWLQCTLDIAGVNSSYTLLCEGCTYSRFGFPHPNGFAIEPQFFGNLLISPALLTYYSLLNNKIKKSQVKLYQGIALFLTTTLFFSFSRGAIYSFSVAIIFLVVFQLIHRRSQYLRLIPLFIISFLLSLTAQGIFSQISPTSDTFLTGITKSIHHLSLGTIDLRGTASESTTSSDGAESTAVFDGYVAESTNVRLELNDIALDLWNDDPMTLLLGTGLGGAGTKAYAKYPSLGTPKQIVQNEYLSLLLEFGLIGIVVIIAAAALLIRTTRPLRSPYLIALLLAYALSLLFFSGLPNALHIYILPVYLLLAENHASIEDIV